MENMSIFNIIIYKTFFFGYKHKASSIIADQDAD